LIIAQNQCTPPIVDQFDKMYRLFVCNQLVITIRFTTMAYSNTPHVLFQLLD